jgi:hypothetical protein
MGWRSRKEIMRLGIVRLVNITNLLEVCALDNLSHLIRKKGEADNSASL